MAQFQEFTFDQGADTSIELHLVDKNGAAKNLTGYSVAAKVKKNYADSAGEATAFTTNVTDVTGGITTLTLTNSQTAALRSGRHVYDVEISFTDSSGNTIIERILEGRIQVTPQVT
mgnify:FL=1|tara:strand:+ start:28200 stop:28547 length:348 start_codon:yes stop_codon:yes gene_type:complete